jgi:SAM-dependent methyltransferase
VIRPAITIFTVDVHLDGGTIAGHLRDARHRVRTFTGWVEFASAVDAVLAAFPPPSIPHSSEVPMLDTDDARVAPATGYLLDPAWHAERDRLTSLTQLYDPATLRLSTSLGLAAGWRCLEVGAGTGTVAELFAAAVGDAGTVLAVDIDTRFLEPLATGNLQVQLLDVTVDALPVGLFDLVHARLFLEHLPYRDAVLDRLVSAVAPGGWLLIEDLDWATAGVLDPPSPIHQLVVDACLTLFGGLPYDPYYGRTVPRALGRAGLLDVGTSAESQQVRADVQTGLPQWELFIEQLAPALLAKGLLTRGDLDAFSALWHDGQTVCFAPLMVSSWGRRPGVDDHDAVSQQGAR